MKHTMRRVYTTLLATAATLVAAGVQAQTPYGLWNFDADLSATIGDSLDYSTSTVQTGSKFGTTTSFGIADINGTAAKVMKFPANTDQTGYIFNTPPTSNGGDGAGSMLNDFTIVFDLYYPTSSDSTKRLLIQTDDGIATGNNVEISIQSNNGIGSTLATAQGSLTAGTWNRVALVFNSESGYLIKYINGQEVGQESIGDYDGSFALPPSGSVIIFGTAGSSASPGYVNSLAFWDSALDAGHIIALGSAVASGIPQTMPSVPSFINSRYPGVGATDIPPLPTFTVDLQPGDTTISSDSISLLLDGVAMSANVESANGGYSITAVPSSLLNSLSTHTLSLVYSDNSVGKQTNNWSFVVQSFQNVTLPDPIYLETFDEVAEGGLPDGWSVTNNTTVVDSGNDLSDPNSDAYLSFLVLSSDTIASVFSSKRFEMPIIYLNGVLVDELINNNVLWMDSDVRSGTQVGVAFSKDYDLTGKNNIFVSWKSIYEQNQDNIACVEYSIDQGTTWLPVIYYLDSTGDSSGADLVYTNDVLDVGATFGTARSDQPYSLAYSNFIGAVVSTNLIPYVVGCANDDTLDGKRIEVVRLPKADNQSKVRFRFCYAGSGSWYFGIDDFGLYSINTPSITTQPVGQTVNAGASVTLGVVATSSTPMEYQWQLNSKNIADATNSTLTISSAAATDAGDYTVVVSNSGGSTVSQVATLTVLTVPVITLSPSSQLVSAKATVILSGQAQGGLPLSYLWLFNGKVISGATSTNLVFASIQSSNAGNYTFVASNSYGIATSAVATVTISTVGITNKLVAHYTFDDNYDDSTGNGANGSAVGTPTFESGVIGKAVHLISANDLSTNNYVTLGYPDVLKFGTNNFSVAFWTKLYYVADDKPFVCNKDWGSGGNSGWVIATEPDGMKWNMNDSDKSGRKDSSHVGSKLEDQNWHQVTVTFERAGNGKIYIDGVLTDTTSIAPSTGVIGSLDTDDLGYSINFCQDGRGDYTDGGSAAADMLLDDVGFWSRILTPQEISSIYVQGLAGKDLTAASGEPVDLPPTITTSPVSQAASVGDTVSFKVVSSGTGTMVYSWFKDGAVLSSATTSNLSFTAKLTDAGAYYAVVANSGGSVTSSVARLVVFSGGITNDLVLHLKFDGDYKDSSGRGNNASAVGSPSFVAGKVGQAFQFSSAIDGSSFNYATLGAPADLQFGTNDFSVSFWINYTTSTDDPSFISDKDWNSSSNPGWGVFAQNSGSFKVNATGPNGSSDKFNTAYSTIVRDGTWHLITVSYWRGQSVLTYVDGTLISSLAFATAGTLDTSLNVNIGQDGTGTYTDGNAASITAQIDDLGIWRRVLTVNEIQTIYTAGQAGKDLTQQSGGEVTTLELSYTRLSTGSIQLTWTADSSVKLQQSPTIGSGATWTDVSGTLGAGSVTIQATNAAAFYRLAK